MKIKKKTIAEKAENVVTIQEVEKPEEIETEMIPQQLEELAEFVDKAIDEISEEVTEDLIKEYEEMEEMIKPSVTLEDIYQMQVENRKYLVDLEKAVNTRNAEDISLFKGIFKGIKEIKNEGIPSILNKVGKWYIISSIVVVFASGALFTTVYHHWDKIEPKMATILNIGKVLAQSKNIAGDN